jgi:hypothetical protein
MESLPGIRLVTPPGVAYNMSKYYANFLETLNNNNIKYIVFGSQALHLLNKKHELDVEFDLSEKDLDIVIDINDTGFIEQNFMPQKIQTKFVNKFHPIYNKDRTQKIDVLLSLPRRNLVIDNFIMLGADYKSLIDYAYKDILYEVELSVLTIEAYYGIVKNAGLVKHKHIIEKIQQKMPELKERVRA